MARASGSLLRSSYRSQCRIVKLRIPVHVLSRCRKLQRCFAHTCACARTMKKAAKLPIIRVMVPQGRQADVLGALSARLAGMHFRSGEPARNASLPVQLMRGGSGGSQDSAVVQVRACRIVCVTEIHVPDVGPHAQSCDSGQRIMLPCHPCRCCKLCWSRPSRSSAARAAPLRSAASRTSTAPALLRTLVLTKPRGCAPFARTVARTSAACVSAWSTAFRIVFRNVQLHRLSTPC